MMKIIYFIILILCIASPALADGLIIGAPAASGCDTCTGNLIFTSHFENNDDLTQGTPCGCTTNADTTWDRSGGMSYSTQTYTGWPTDGSYSLYSSGTQTASIPISVSKTAGTITFDYYMPTFNTYATLISLYQDEQNMIRVATADTNNALLYYKGNNVQQQTAASAAEFTAGAKHSVVAKWSTAGVGGLTLSLSVDGGTAHTSTGTLTQPTATLNLYLGKQTGSGSGAFYIDNLKIYDSWQ